MLAASVQSNADADSLQTGVWGAGNATQYNYLLHHEVKEMLAEVDGKATETEKNEVRARYAQLDEARNQELASVCQAAPQACDSLSTRLIDDEPKLRELAKTLSAQGRIKEAATIAAITINNNAAAGLTIATELAAQRDGNESSFLAAAAATLLGATLGGMRPTGSGAKEVPAVKWSAQEKHFPGHNSYTPGRSVLSSDPRKLAESAGTGQQVGNIPVGMPGSKERVNFGGPIGTYIDGAGVATPTANGIIHYSKDGIHIVPARP